MVRRTGWAAQVRENDVTGHRLDMILNMEMEMFWIVACLQNRLTDMIK